MRGIRLQAGLARALIVGAAVLTLVPLAMNGADAAAKKAKHPVAAAKAQIKSPAPVSVPLPHLNPQAATAGATSPAPSAAGSAPAAPVLASTAPADAIGDFISDHSDRERSVSEDSDSPEVAPVAPAQPPPMGTELQGKVKIVKLNVDENPSTTVKYGVRSIPTMILYKGGEAVDMKIGAGTPKAGLSKWLTSYAA